MQKKPIEKKPTGKPAPMPATPSGKHPGGNLGEWLHPKKKGK